MKFEILFWTADWCSPCEAMKKRDTLKKAIAALGELRGEQVLASVEEIDVDLAEDRADDARVQSMPTIDLLVNGKQVSRVVGALSAPEYAKKWNKALKAIAS